MIDFVFSEGSERFFVGGSGDVHSTINFLPRRGAFFHDFVLHHEFLPRRGAFFVILFAPP